MVKRSLCVLALVLSMVAAAPLTAGATVLQGQDDGAQKVDVNRASEVELQRVPGIGPAMARRIVEWRTENGPFERLEDLLDIRGIGSKTLEKLRPYLTLGEDEGSAGS